MTPLKAGDSVRLKMETKYFSEKFFERKFTHADVGYILEMMNDQGRVCLLNHFIQFPCLRFAYNGFYLVDTVTLKHIPVEEGCCRTLIKPVYILINY